MSELKVNIINPAAGSNIQFPNSSQVVLGNTGSATCLIVSSATGESINVNSNYRIYTTDGTIKSTYGYKSPVGPTEVLGTVTQHPLALMTSNSTAMTIGTDANIGVGIAPLAAASGYTGYALSIRRNGAYPAYVSIYNQNMTSNSAGAGYRMNNNISNAGIILNGVGTSVGSCLQMYADTGVTGGILISTANNSATIRFQTKSTNRMLISEDGNLGIGGSQGVVYSSQNTITSTAPNTPTTSKAILGYGVSEDFYGSLGVSEGGVKYSFDGFGGIIRNAGDIQLPIGDITLGIGNIGIGITAQYKLHILGSNPTINLENTNASGGGGGKLIFGHSQSSSTLPIAQISGFLTNGSGAGARAGDLIFSTSNGGTLTGSMWIHDDGRVTVASPGGALLENLNYSFTSTSPANKAGGAVLGYCAPNGVGYGILGYTSGGVAYSFYGSGTLYNSGNIASTGTIVTNSNILADTGLIRGKYFEPYGQGYDSGNPRTFTGPSAGSSGLTTGAGGTGSVMPYDIYQEGGTWVYPYPDLVLSYHTGIKVVAYETYGGTRFYSDFRNVADSEILMSVGDNSKNVKVRDTLIAGSLNVTGQGAFIGGANGTTQGLFVNLNGTDAATVSTNLSNMWTRSPVHIKAAGTSTSRLLIGGVGEAAAGLQASIAQGGGAVDLTIQPYGGSLFIGLTGSGGLTGVTAGSATVVVNGTVRNKNPAFQVTYVTTPSRLGGGSGVGTGKELVWDSKQLDVTSSFSTTTGRFTAPVGGRYNFNANIFFNLTGNAANSSQYGYWWFVKNGMSGGSDTQVLPSRSQYFFTPNVTGSNFQMNYHNVSGSWIAELGVGDYVSVWYNGSPYSAGYSSFNGYFLG